MGGENIIVPNHPLVETSAPENGFVLNNAEGVNEDLSFSNLLEVPVLLVSTHAERTTSKVLALDVTVSVVLTHGLKVSGVKCISGVA